MVNTGKFTFSLPAAIAVLLWLAVLVSVIAVVTVSHQSRLHFGLLEQARKQAFDLKGEASRIALEYQSFARLSLLEARASDELQMVIVKPESMVVTQ